MDNICIKKVWEDDGLIELFVKAQSQFATINQTCYISTEDLKNNAKSITEYTQNNLKTYVEFGKIEGDFSPAFAMKLDPCDNYGHVIIEIDMEIDDNQKREHRCKFFLNTELGLLEMFGEKLRSIIEMEINKCIYLYDE